MHEMEEVWELLTAEGYTITIQPPICGGAWRFMVADKSQGEKSFCIPLMMGGGAVYSERVDWGRQFAWHDANSAETILQFVKRMIKQ